MAKEKLKPAFNQKKLGVTENILAFSDTVLDMMNAVYHDKLLIFIPAMFREKLVSRQ